MEIPPPSPYLAAGEIGHYVHIGYFVFDAPGVWIIEVRDGGDLVGSFAVEVWRSGS